MSGTGNGIRVGTDIIEIQRIRSAAMRHPGFFDRILTPNEKEYCLSKADAFVSLAGRFAAKEAVLKSLGTGLAQISWLDMEILADKNGSPQVLFSGSAEKILRVNGIKYINVSISHSRDYAVAVAVGECVADEARNRV